jgi:predicted metal-dependent hydrolase
MGVRINKLCRQSVMWGQLFNFNQKAEIATESLQIGGRSVSMIMVRHPRARRYLLRLRPDGTVRVTMPRRGSIAHAKEFVRHHIGWLEQQLVKQATLPKSQSDWAIGTEFYFRGEKMRIEAESAEAIRFGTERLPVKEVANLRPTIEKHLRQLATKELPARVMELAKLHGISVERVTVRNQRTRWGSCSRRGTISLNWRLIQTPALVRDYIILHELAHRRQMNHSQKFWEEVARLCPGYLEAERWLKAHAILLR